MTIYSLPRANHYAVLVDYALLEDSAIVGFLLWPWDGDLKWKEVYPMLLALAEPKTVLDGHIQKTLLSLDIKDELVWKNLQRKSLDVWFHLKKS